MCIYLIKYSLHLLTDPALLNWAWPRSECSLFKRALSWYQMTVFSVQYSVPPKGESKVLAYSCQSACTKNSSVSIKNAQYVLLCLTVFSRERPAAISINIKSIDDTSNFDEFPDSDILTPTGRPSGSVNSTLCYACVVVSKMEILSSSTATQVSNQTEADLKNKDWVFINYTYKRFEGLTARGAIPSYMKSGKR